MQSFERGKTTTNKPELKLSVCNHTARLSVGAHWRQQFTCPTKNVWKHSSFLSTEHTKSDATFILSEVRTILCEFYSLALAYAHTGGNSSRVNNTCFEILSFFGASAHQVGYLSKRRSYPLRFKAWSYRATVSVG
ncbi:hypothetical protein PoB_002836100 [Plakobranchus ocellatus]|uniref:Uncharacterized protein n=1 Tax=Plakobranchus ocellatus TaxID=259542 RepID=A0AAV3ZS06_9GAST|nr:hypothetical protein PoB_002836100 [Plakobranchus ocellatus]